MSDCIHCDIHDLIDQQGNALDLREVAAKVTEVLADLILQAPPEERGDLMADVLANLGEFVLHKRDEAPTEAGPRRH